MDGLLIVDKPVGPTSHDVVARVRRALGERRIGHTGTLNPMASGVLPLVLGRATRLARFLSATEKTYIAVVRLGMETDSHVPTDSRSAIRTTAPCPIPRRSNARWTSFRGTFLQQPPRFSATKVGGIRSHALARQQRAQPSTALRPGPSTSLAPGPVVATPVSVTVSDLRLLGDASGNDVELAHRHVRPGSMSGRWPTNWARQLGTGAHLAALQRTRVSDLRLEDAIALDAIVGDAKGAFGRGDPDGAAC